MTQDQIIEFAQQADDFADSYTPYYVTLPNEWQEIRDKRFAHLVAQYEREACANVLDRILDQFQPGGRVYMLLQACVNAIRAREEQ